MSEFGHSTIPEAMIFAWERNIPVIEDLRAQSPPIKPGLARNRGGSLEQTVTDTGAEYSFAQLDYFVEGVDDEPNVRVSRMIATILAGKRTELAYWTPAAPTKQIDIHQGRGELAIGNPADGSLELFKLDSAITPHVTLPAGRFYTFHASPWTPQPLVVSGLYPAEAPVDWESMELYFEPGQAAIETAEGAVEVPPAFHDVFRRYGD